MITLISAPSNRGLRPPAPGAVPGTAKAPEALREAGLHRKFTELGASDGGVVIAPRYLDDDATRGPGVMRNQAAIIDYSRALAQRIGATLDSGRMPLVLGGDCSILLGAGLALKRRGKAGLVHLDGHTDFRHPGNSSAYGSLAGEDLAAAIGTHVDEIADIDGWGPYFAAETTTHIGHRADDEHAAEVRAVLGLTRSAARAMRDGAGPTARAVHATSGSGYWMQLDVDILDPGHLHAVDSPAPGGFTTGDLVELLRALAPRAVGASVTVFDPDLDPSGSQALTLVDVLTRGLAELGTARRG